MRTWVDVKTLVLKAGLTPSASGSAYLELESSSVSTIPRSPLHPQTSGLKLTCTVHGPHPLPRSAAFTSQLLLSTRVKFAPFATKQRRGYIPDSVERDLATHLETALQGILIGDRWPKSGIDIVVTVLEGEEEHSSLSGARSTEGWGIMSILSGCITVASAAIADAGIDCVDLATGGVAAMVQSPTGGLQLVLDPCPSDHNGVAAACVVGYLHSRDEITEAWALGNIDHSAFGTDSRAAGIEPLMNMAIEAATAARLVLIEAIKEVTEAKIQSRQLGGRQGIAETTQKAG